MNIRSLKNFIRSILGLPVYKTRDEINCVIIVDNGEPLVDITEIGKLKVNFDPKTSLRKSEFDAVMDHKIRKTAYEMLVRASQLLPEGYTLFVLEAFRPYDVQLARFDAKFAKLRKEFPSDVSDDEVRRRTRLGIADPRAGAPHQTGGAVDVTIIDASGNPLDMGTVWAEFNKETPTHNWMYITSQQRKNRKLLLGVMTAAGFVNYPGEWWHYSYGDRAWAAYGGKESAIYGPIE